jgi:hypothetical protein
MPMAREVTACGRASDESITKFLEKATAAECERREEHSSAALGQEVSNDEKVGIFLSESFRQALLRVA